MTVEVVFTIVAAVIAPMLLFAWSENRRYAKEQKPRWFRKSILGPSWIDSAGGFSCGHILKVCVREWWPDPERLSDELIADGVFQSLTDLSRQLRIQESIVKYQVDYFRHSGLGIIGTTNEEGDEEGD